ncbi:MAG: hypothetical protein HZA03_03205 [Nitrospinae bacterium]|nr:hypothetical protein [Nitrospinota bacterium]
MPDSSHAADEAKERLRAVHATLNPFHLKKEIEKKLRGFFNDLRFTESLGIDQKSAPPSVAFSHEATRPAKIVLGFFTDHKVKQLSTPPA